MKTYWSLFIGLLIFSCNKNEQTTHSLNNNQDSIVNIMSTLEDSVLVSYQNLKSIDSIKFSNIKRLLEEISYCKTFDQKGVETLLAFNAQLSNGFIPIDSLTDQRINTYDSLSILLVSKVRNLKENTKEIIQHPIAETLENQILETDNNLIIKYRSIYDSHVKNYNSFYETNKSILLNSSLKNIKPSYATFSISQI
jgi:hypothetical protein